MCWKRRRNTTLLTFPYQLVRLSGFSSLVSAIAVLLYPLTNVLKVLQSLVKSRESQKPSLISKEKVNKEKTNNYQIFWERFPSCALHDAS